MLPLHLLLRSRHAHGQRHHMGLDATDRDGVSLPDHRQFWLLVSDLYGFQEGDSQVQHPTLATRHFTVFNHERARL